MPHRNKSHQFTHLKFEISEIEHEISHMKVDLEYFQQQGLLIRQLIQEREQRISELVHRVDRTENFKSRLRGDSDE